jgi:DNA-binding transcriptional LysR family regulator
MGSRRKSNDRIGRIAMMDLTGFDLNLLRVFVAISRERSVTRAGEQIAMSQPAVSAALNRLRYVLDDQLFVRRGNDMVPTPRAEELIGPLQEALDKLQAALQVKRPFDPAAATRVYTLLGADFFSMLLMPRLSERLARRAPHVRLRLLDSGRGDADRMLRDDTADVLLEGPLDLPDWVSSQTLFKSEFAVVARQDHPELRARGVAPGDVIPLDLFCALPHALRTIEGGMTGFTDAALERVGRSRRVTLVLPHFHAVLTAVARGDLLAAIPRRFAEAFAAGLNVGLYRSPVELPTPNIDMYWHSRHDRDPAHRWLRDEIVAALAELPAAP